MYLTLALSPITPDKYPQKFTLSRVISPLAAWQTSGYSAAVVQQRWVLPTLISSYTTALSERGGREGTVRYTGRYDNISFIIKTTYRHYPTCVSDFSPINHITKEEGKAPNCWDRQPPPREQESTPDAPIQAILGECR